MLLVVDANIVISSLIGGKLDEIIFSPKLELIAPERLFIEIRRHQEEILSKAKMSGLEFDILLILLEKKIKVVSMDEFILFFTKAEELLKEHKKDLAYLSLALKYKCPFWSYEKRFGKIGEVESLTTSEVRSKLDNV